MAARSKPRGYKDVFYAEVDWRPLLRALNGLPKELTTQLRDENQALARQLAGELRAAATIDLYGRTPPQAELVAKSLKPKHDRLVQVDIGGNTPVGRKYKSTKQGKRYSSRAGALLYGSEFGSSGKPRDSKGRAMGARFVARHNPQGYWINPTVKAFAPEAYRIWRERIDRYLKMIGASPNG